LQNDVLPELVAMHFEDTDVDHEWSDLEQHAKAWRLLLQLEDDAHLGASFGDGGSLYFGLPAEDLASGRFDRVQAITQSG
jgi:uncharacterized protein YwqG